MGLSAEPDEAGGLIDSPPPRASTPSMIVGRLKSGILETRAMVRKPAGEESASSRLIAPAVQRDAPAQPGDWALWQPGKRESVPAPRIIALCSLRRPRRAVPQGGAKDVAAEVDGALLQRSARDARARLFGGRLRNASKHNIALASDLPNPGFVAPVGWRPPYAARSHDALQPATMTAGPAPSRGNRMPARRASNISRRADPHPSPWVLWPIMARVHRRDRARQ